MFTECQCGCLFFIFIDTYYFIVKYHLADENNKQLWSLCVFFWLGCVDEQFLFVLFCFWLMTVLVIHVCALSPIAQSSEWHSTTWTWSDTLPGLHAGARLRPVTNESLYTGIFACDPTCVWGSDRPCPPLGLARACRGHVNVTPRLAQSRRTREWPLSRDRVSPAIAPPAQRRCGLGEEGVGNFLLWYSAFQDSTTFQSWCNADATFYPHGYKPYK